MWAVEKCQPKESPNLLESSKLKGSKDSYSPGAAGMGWMNSKGQAKGIKSGQLRDDNEQRSWQK